MSGLRICSASPIADHFHPDLRLGFSSILVHGGELVRPGRGQPAQGLIGIARAEELRAIKPEHAACVGIATNPQREFVVLGHVSAAGEDGPRARGKDF